MQLNRTEVLFNHRLRSEQRQCEASPPTYRGPAALGQRFFVIFLRISAAGKVNGLSRNRKVDN